MNFWEAYQEMKKDKWVLVTKVNKKYKINSCGVIIDETGTSVYPLTVCFVESEFSIEKKQITITESQFDEACKKYDFYSHHSKLKKELGF